MATMSDLEVKVDFIKDHCAYNNVKIHWSDFFAQLKYGTGFAKGHFEGLSNIELWAVIGMALNSERLVGHHRLYEWRL